MVFRRRRKHHGCPGCGHHAGIRDNFCSNCGTSLKRTRKKSGLKKYLLIIIILVGIYIGLRYSNGLSLIPVSIEDAFRLKP